MMSSRRFNWFVRLFRRDVRAILSRPLSIRKHYQFDICTKGCLWGVFFSPLPLWLFANPIKLSHHARHNLRKSALTQQNLNWARLLYVIFFENCHFVDFLQLWAIFGTLSLCFYLFGTIQTSQYALLRHPFLVLCSPLDISNYLYRISLIHAFLTKNRYFSMNWPN